jgi:hypothetical protein
VTDWLAGADAIAEAFADPELLAYTVAGSPDPGGAPLFIPAIRHEGEGTGLNEGGTNRRISYEIQFSALPQKPTKRDTFVHRSTLWRISNVTTLDEVFAWDCDVTNGGPV